MDGATASLVVGLSSAGVAVVAILANTAGTRKTLDQQRYLALQDRLWDRRADTYVELIEVSGHLDDSRGWQALRTLTGRVTAFASDEVRESFEALMGAGEPLTRGGGQAGVMLTVEEDETITITKQSLYDQARKELLSHAPPSSDPLR